MNRVYLLPLILIAACGGGSNDWVTPPSSNSETVGSSVRIVGVVRRVALEGGFYAIVGSDGITYDPTNLPVAFQKDGLAVEAVARRRPDMLGIHQVGPIVDLERIRTR
ncbi:MAG: hypothetical protein ACTHM9_15775 [Gemmatimonadales bacterium]|jgi:hypothetical protein